MLVLTRKLGECICIDDDIKITIQAIKGNQVRLGITAPRTTVVHREEIYQRIQAENVQAAKQKADIERINQIWRELNHQGQKEEKP